VKSWAGSANRGLDRGLGFWFRAANSFKMWWPGTDLNRRRQPFQGCALPPELPGHLRCGNSCGCDLKKYSSLSTNVASVEAKSWGVLILQGDQ
jgi:hypothetical protein